MSLIKLRGRVTENGQLLVDLPWKTTQSEVEVLVEDPDGAEERKQRLLKNLEESFGSMPDLVRPDQGEMPPPLTW